jgi:hypothetical protein
MTAATAEVIPVSDQVAVTPVRKATSKSLLRLADEMARAHPGMTVHRHLEDAAGQVRIGNDEGALRHLRAAATGLQPQSLHRHGIHEDDGHKAARQALEGVTRHQLLVKDIQDADARNEAAIMRDSYGDDGTAPPHPDPNNGYGPGALAQKPVARQPPGGQAMNAPPRTNAGRPDVNVADPDSPQPAGSKQFARTWDEVCATAAYVVEMSARTPMLETTPAPRGRSGGPGLYDVKGMGHDPYFQQIVKALIEKRGMPPDRAYRIAWSALRRWQGGGGHVHPEVKVAAAKTLIDEAAKAARARAMHGHD